MGIVRKQSTYSTIFIYLGFVIGAINLLLLFPRFLSPEQIGLTRLMIDFSLFFSALCTLGSLIGFYKFHPFYHSYLKLEENDLPFLTIMASVIGSVLFIAGSIIFKGYLARKFGQNSPLFIIHYNLVIPFTVSVTCMLVLEAFCWIMKRTILSNIMKELFYRITVTGIILLYALKLISIETFFLLFSFSYIPTIIVLIYFVFIKEGGLKLYTQLSKVTKRLYKKMLLFVSFHFSGLLINILPKTIDGIFIAGLSANGLANLAVYMYPNYLVTLMEVPQRSMTGIATALISEAWRNKDRVKITELYQKTSLNLLVIGLAIFGVIYPNMDNLIRYLGPDYHLAKIIFLIAGTAKLVDLGMGMNSQIMALSPFWRFDFFTSILFIAINIVLDYFLIKSYGIMGATYGSSIALICYNLMRCFYLWYLYQIHPFNIKSIFAIIIMVIAMTFTYLLPYLGNLFLDTAVRALLFIILYLPAILYFRLSDDINDLWRIMMGKLKTHN